MVRAIDSSAWRDSISAERLRPGIAISLVLHAVLLLALGYYLAFSPGTRFKENPDADVLKIIDLPRTLPPPTKPVPRTFNPEPPPKVINVPTTVDPLPIPPTVNYEHTKTTVVTSQTSAPPVIIDARAVFRGGLVYPDKALDRGMVGYVDFLFTIEPDGSVGDLHMTAETPSGFGFAAAAIKAFAKWKFEPKMVDGRAVPATARYRVSFKLQ